MSKDKNEHMAEIIKRFELSAKMIKSLKRSPTDDELLKLYGYYKQSNNGDCTVQEPSKLFNYREYCKWNAWTKVKGMDQFEAMDKYSDYAMIILDKYSSKK